MKSKIKLLLKKIYYIAICKIPNIYYLIIYVPYIKYKILKSKVKNVKIYNYKYWHFGYMYFRGFYRNKQVFIKYNKYFDIIEHEFNIIKKICKCSHYLSNKIPHVYELKKIGKGGYLIEDFFELSSLKDEIGVISKEKCKTISEEIIRVLEEFQRIHFLHLDINLSNLYLNSKSEIYLIDFGYSTFNENESFNYLKKKQKKFVINHLNEYSRLEIGCIDDAVSFLMICSDLNSDFIRDETSKWKKLNSLSNKLVWKDNIENEN